jgi:hypothetical protein
MRRMKNEVGSFLLIITIYTLHEKQENHIADPNSVRGRAVYTGPFMTGVNTHFFFSPGEHSIDQLSEPVDRRAWSGG